MAVEPPTSGWRERLFRGLAKSRDAIGGQIDRVFARGHIDDDAYEALETALLTADVGVAASTALLDALKDSVKRQAITDPERARAALLGHLGDLLKPLESPLVIDTDKRPFVVMVAGVNGSGKTTSIGKLAHHFKSQGYSLILAAGDTFRAAAREQLQHWGEANGVAVIGQQGGDPAAVAFDAISAAKARGIDIVIVDTAGRLPTQAHLMDEISRVRRVMQKIDDTAPHETLLVLDGSIGQNALLQVQAFDRALSVSGLLLTKLDGSAKGGVVAAIAKTCPRPLRFIGVGESVDDLRPFEAALFAAALVNAA